MSVNSVTNLFSSNYYEESKTERPTDSNPRFPLPKSKIYSYDRFIPSRQAMHQSSSFLSESVPTPKTSYEKALTQTLFPYYSSRTLLFKEPVKFTSSTMEKDNLHILPQLATKVLDAPDLLRDFYTHNIDWGNPLLAVNLGNCCYTWNREENKVVRRTKHENPLSCVKWSPQDLILATGDRKSVLKVKDIVANKRLFSLTNLNDFQSIICMDWRSGNELTVGSLGSLHHIDIRTNQIIKIGNEEGTKICSLAWNKDQNLLAAGCNNNTVVVYDIRRAGKKVHAHMHSAGIKALAWMPNQETPLLLSGGGSECRVFKVVDVNTHKVLCQEKADAQICSVAFINDQYFVAGLQINDGTNLQSWRVIPGESILRKIEGNDVQDGRIINVAKKPNSPTLASLSEEETINIWDLDLESKTKLQPNPKKSVLENFEIR